MMLDRETFWSDTLRHIQDGDRTRIVEIVEEAQQRRRLASYDTGSVTGQDALLLRALSRRFSPKLAIEIGTFIGTSTFAIKAGTLYTCDKDNACVPSQKGLVTFPKTRSTKMLQELCGRLKPKSVSFWFFDGRIKNEDLAFIVRLATDCAKFIFHDYEGKEKGVINVAKLLPVLPAHYRTVQPIPDGSSTLALLMPGNGE